MNCTEVNQKIVLFILGELSKSERAAIKAHLTTCSACKDTEIEYRSLVAKIERAAQTKPLNFTFVQRIHSVAKAEIRSIVIHSFLRRMITLTASAAACLLLTLAIRQAWTSSGGKEGHLVTKNPSKVSLVKPSSTPGSPSVLEVRQYRSPRSVPGSIADGVIVHGQNMYLLQEHDRQTFVAAIDIKTGKQKWLSDIHSCGYILADDSRLYCLSPSGTEKLDLIALNADSGELLWRYQQQTEQQQNLCRPILLSGGRICWTTNKTVNMISCANGNSLWTHSIPDGGLLSSAVVVDNDLYVANSIGCYCLNAATGNESWKLDYGDAASSRSRPMLAVAGSEIYISLSPGLSTSRLICMETIPGRILWSKTTPHITHLNAIDDILYLRNQNIQALDGTTGKLIWNCPATGCNPVTYSDKLAYFVDSSSWGCLIALDRYTGCKVWELQGIKSCNAFIKVDGTGFIKGQDGIIYTINLKG